MGRVILAAGLLVVVVISLVAVAMASQLGVFSDLSGKYQRSSSVTLSDSGWKSAPEDPRTVYISIIAPNVRLREAIKGALDNVTRSHGLKPVYVNGSIADYDLKGRIVVVYIPVDFWSGGFLGSEYGVSGVLYYSYPGDSKTFVELMLSRNVSKETGETIKRLALELSSSSVRRLKEERVLNQSVSIAYWWNLRAVVGKLRRGDPYRMIAQQIATRLNEFLEGS